MFQVSLFKPWGLINGLPLPPGSEPLPSPMYVPSAQGSLRGTPKNHWFSSQPPGQQKPWKWLPKLQKIMKNRPWIRNPISVKVDFCNTFHAKCLFLHSRTSKFKAKIIRKKQPENSYEQIFRFPPKTVKMDPLNQQKIDKIQAWTSQGRSLCPSMSQGRPWIVPGTPRTPK